MEIEMTIKGLMIDPITNMPIIILRDQDGEALVREAVRELLREQGSTMGEAFISLDLACIEIGKGAFSEAASHASHAGERSRRDASEASRSGSARHRAPGCLRQGRRLGRHQRPSLRPRHLGVVRWPARSPHAPAGSETAGSPAVPCWPPPR